MKRIVTLLACLLATAAGAQGVWRCEAGRTLYADVPCPGGQALDLADPRTPQQLREGQRAAAIDRELARRLVADRHEREREAQQPGAGLGGIRSATPAPVRSVKPRMQKQSRRHRRSADDAWQAARHGSRPGPG